MFPEHTFYTVLISVVLFFGNKTFKQWLDYKKDQRDSEVEAKNQSLWHSTYEKYSNMLNKFRKF